MQEDREKCVSGFKEQGCSEWFAKAMVELEEVLSSGEFDFTTGDALKLLNRQPQEFSDFLELHKQVFV